jgi:hypothetical protein
VLVYASIVDWVYATAPVPISRPTAKTVENAAILYFMLSKAEQLVSNITCSAQAAQHALPVLVSAPTVDRVFATAPVLISRLIMPIAENAATR